MGDRLSKVQEEHTKAIKQHEKKSKKEKKKCASCGVFISAKSFKHRKHICNSCGGKFCGNCTKKKKVLPLLDSKKKGPQRVCDNCYLVDHNKESKDELLQKIQRRNQAAITIQRFARGYMTRQYYKMICKRTQIVKELFETEQTYCTHLAAIVTLYIRPLIQQQTVPTTKGLSFLKKEPLIDGEQRKILFSVTEVLYQIHSQIEQNLEKRLYHWYDTQMIGDIFSEVKDLLKCYSTYVNNYDASVELLKKLNKKDDWLKFQNAAKKDPLSKNLDLVSLLITPIQRIPRYVLLLQDLLNSTPKKHPDCAIMEAALADIRDLADFINTSKKEAELQIDVVRVYRLLKPSIPDLVLPHRKFVFEDDFEQIMTSTPNKDSTRKIAKKESKALHFFLFNDMLLITKPKKNHFVPKFQMLLSSTTLVNNDVRGVKTSFLLYDDKMSLTCAAMSEEVKNKFVAAYDEQKQVFEEKKTRMLRSTTVGSSEEAKSPLSFFRGKSTISKSFLNIKNKDTVQ